VVGAACALFGCVAPAASSLEAGAPVAASRPDDGLPYDRWHQKSVHNAYDHMDSIGDQLRVHGFRSVEIDIHEGKLGAASIEADWWVYHVAIPGFDDSSCATLSACLEQIDAYHREVPEHDVLTVFIDVKDELEAAGHRPRELDARVRASLAAGALFEPRDMLRRCPKASSLRDAVAGSCSWPTLGELRGRVLVVLTGGDVCSRDARLSTYLGEHPDERAAFVAPRISETCDVASQARSGEVVFFNLDGDSFHQARTIGRAHLVSRGFGGGWRGGIDDHEQWVDALEAGVNILATDRIDAERDPWTNGFAPPPPRPARNVAGR